MADSASKRTRSRKSLGAASSPPVADQRDIASGRDSPAVGIAVNKESILPGLVTPVHQKVKADSTRKASSSVKATVSKGVVPDMETPLIIHTPLNSWSARSQGSRPSVASTSSASSASTTGSSIKIDTGFDRQDQSSSSDSNQTTPEEDAISPRDKQIPSSYFKNAYREPPEPESPSLAARRRRELSAKVQKKTPSRPSISLKPPSDTGRRRSSSAPDPEPCSDDSSNSNDYNSIIDDLRGMSLEDKDATILRGSRKGEPRNHAKLAAEQGGRPSSAAGRMEEMVTERTEIAGAPRERHIRLPDQMDWEPTSYSSLPQSGKALQPGLPTKSMVADVKQLARRHKILKIPGTQPNTCVSDPIKTSRPTAAPSKAQQQRARNDVHIREQGKPEMSSAAEQGPTEIFEDDSGSDSDFEHDTSHLTDVDAVLSANGKTHMIEEREAQSDEEPEPHDPGDSDSDSDSECDISSEAINLDDDPSSSDVMLEAGTIPTADSERPYPDFRSYEDNPLLGKDIKDDLIELIGKQIPRPKAGKKVGSIYVYSGKFCPRFFKAGFTTGPVDKRLKYWGKCEIGIFRVEDCNHRCIRNANRVEKLVETELHHFRRKFTCRKHKQRNTKEPQVHTEWYEIPSERLLQVIEKWRDWITMLENNPYDEDGFLTPRWAWKLDKFRANREGLQHLDHFLQPFTDWEDWMYRKDWFLATYKELYRQGRLLNKARTSSTLFLVTVFILLFLVYKLGPQAGMFCFFTLGALIVYVLSG